MNSLKIHSKAPPSSSSANSAAIPNLTRRHDENTDNLQRDMSDRCTLHESPPAPITPVQKGKFTVTEAKPTSMYSHSNNPRKECSSSNEATSSKTDVLSISFLSKAVQDDNFPPKQVIQKALTSLRPGGVFFVLDYMDQDFEQVPEPLDKPPASPQACSLAMKEMPDELMEKYNIIVIPTNLETFYNEHLVDESWSKPAPARTSVLPSSQRVIRWMGVKPPLTPA